MNVKRTAKTIAFYFFLIASLLLSGCGPGQLFGPTPTPTTGTVEGTIMQDGAPVNEIVVGLLNAEKEGTTPTPGPEPGSAPQDTKTDEKGKYIFKDIFPGEYFVTLVVLVENTDMKCIFTEPVTVRAGGQVKMDFSIPKEIDASMGIATLPDGKFAFCVKR